MKRLFGMAIFALCLVVLGSAAQTQLVPLAVSPGSEGAVAVVRQDCPTFSWTAVDWALGYRVAVFQAFETEVPGYEQMAAVGAPLLSKEIPGRALSWTPSAEERLSSGSLYVWYVQALDSSGQGTWSKGKLFLVEAGGGMSGLAERVKKALKEKGVSEDIAQKVLQDMNVEFTDRVSANFDLTGGYRTQGEIRIQGVEGGYNTFYGYEAGKSTTTGIYNSFFGRGAGYYNVGGSDNTFTGYAAGYSNTTGYYNTFMGYAAGYSNTTGYYNTFVGYKAGLNSSTAYYNTFLGDYAGYSNTAGYDNIFVGHAAGYSNTIGFYNIFVGNNTGAQNTTGRQNTFMGYEAGLANTTGLGNTLIGQSSGRAHTTGNYNTYVGFFTGMYNILGSSNTCLGSQAGGSKTGGSGNTLIGSSAGSQSGSSDNNIMIGTSAGAFNTGSNNLLIGDSAGYSGSFSNRLYIAHRQALSFPLIYGEFDNMILITGGRLGVNGRNPATNALEVLGDASKTTAGSWLANSDVRIKTDITEVEDAIGTVKKLHPVKFKYSSEWREKYPSIEDKNYYNFIAQEYRQVFPESVQGSGEYLDGDKDEILQLDSYNAQIVAIKAVQELILKNEEQEKLIHQLLKEVDNLKSMLQSTAKK